MTSAANETITFTAAKDPPEVYGTKVAAGIKAAALIWNCTLKGPVDAKFAYEGKKSKRFLNRPIDDRTKEEYEGVLRLCPYW